MIHKQRDDQEENWSRWPIPEEWKAAEAKSQGSSSNRVTRFATQQLETQERLTRHMAMTASLMPRKLTCAVLGLASPAQKVSSCDELTWNCADLCANLKQNVQVGWQLRCTRLLQVHRGILAMHEEALGGEPHQHPREARVHLCRLLIC